MANFEKQVIYTFYKNPGAWRIKTDPAYFEKLAELRRQYPLGELVGGVHDSEQRFLADVRVDPQPKAKTASKNYTVSVCVEVSCQFEIEASSIKEAKTKALELAESSIDIIFDSNCQSPEVDYLPIKDDAVE